MTDQTDRIMFSDGGQKLSKDHIDAIDRLYWSPQERALGVHNLLENFLKELRVKEPHVTLPTEWDKLCYSVESLGQHAIAVGDENLIVIAKAAALWLYQSHYSHAAKIYGSPDRKREVDKAKAETKKEPNSGSVIKLEKPKKKKKKRGRR